MPAVASSWSRSTSSTPAVWPSPIRRGHSLFGVWQPGAHKGAQLVNEPGAWAMSQLNTSDTEGAKAFYGAVLGWETDTFDMGEARSRCGGSRATWAASPSSQFPAKWSG